VVAAKQVVTRKERQVGIGASLLLIAVGAILRWGVTAEVSGLDIQTIGLILLVVGVIGMVLSLIMWSSLGSWYPGRRRYVRDEVVEDHDYIDRAA
jgi:hypothetical protein